MHKLPNQQATAHKMLTHLSSNNSHRLRTALPTHPPTCIQYLTSTCTKYQCRFSLARSMGCGTRLCSDFFEVGGQLFRLEVYPAGFTADARKHLSVFLTTPGAINPNHILYEVAILDQVRSLLNGSWHACCAQWKATSVWAQ